MPALQFDYLRARNRVMDKCRICGMDFGSPSMGGPGICSACDCGVQPDSIHHPKNHSQYGRYTFTPTPIDRDEIRKIIREEFDRRAAEGK